MRFFVCYPYNGLHQTLIYCKNKAALRTRGGFVLPTAGAVSHLLSFVSAVCRFGGKRLLNQRRLLCFFVKNEPTPYAMSNDSGKCRFGSTRTLSDGHRPVGAYYFRDAHISERICPNTDCVPLLHLSFVCDCGERGATVESTLAYRRHAVWDID